MGTRAPVATSQAGGGGLVVRRGVEGGGGHERLEAKRPQVRRPGWQACGGSDAVQDRVGQRDTVDEHRHGGGAAGPLNRGRGAIEWGWSVLGRRVGGREEDHDSWSFLREGLLVLLKGCLTWGDALIA